MASPFISVSQHGPAVPGRAPEGRPADILRRARPLRARGQPRRRLQVQLRRLHGGLQLPPAARLRHGVRSHAQRHVHRAGRPRAGAVRAAGAAAEAGKGDAHCEILILIMGIHVITSLIHDQCFVE